MDLDRNFWAQEKSKAQSTDDILTFGETLQVEQLLQTVRIANALESKAAPTVSLHANTPLDPKGAYHMVLPDVLQGESVMDLLMFCVRYGHFYDRGAISQLPEELHDQFASGPPEEG